ncbi:MAG: lipocalin-like domain-containing protein [Pseudohongiella sp.]|nr:lipocalin-like domain-containing protein [Pseudohongiella sp.]
MNRIVNIDGFLTAIAAIFVFAMPAQIHAAESLADIKQMFIGDYELVSYFQYPAQGDAIDMNYIGRLSYDSLGNMAGLGMPRDLPQRNEQSSERVTGGFAYWGRVSYDLENSIVIHHVEGSPMVPQWVGGDNIRYFEFTDEFLKLSLKNAQGRITGTLTWRKLG